jgi:hypothetical protein
MRRHLGAALLTVVAPAALAEVRVQQAGELLSVQAQAAPVSEVLDRLSRHTGMQVVYEGVPPRVPVTLSIERRSVAEAVFSVLEGLGLNYALRLDESGGRVLTLVMAGAAGPGAAGPGAAAEAALRGHAAQPPYPQPAYPQEGEGEFDEGVIPPPPPQPPQEFVVNPPPQQPEPQPQAGGFSQPSLGSGFSSPFSTGGFSTPSVFGAPVQNAPATPPPQQQQFVPEQPPEEKEP